ncbi:MAG: hypothetical protein KJ548_06355 [Actinobacteria bacterium]|nr:hypothetical protein [Actinomycetota bacterium]MCG2798385.1 hypothetical protein [Cellulomonas sp.]
MTLATRAVATAALAALVAVLGYLGALPLAVVSALLAVAFGLGWPSLAALPDPPGSAVVIALSGIGAVAVVYTRSAQQAPDLRDLAIVFAGSVLLTFVNELLRRDGRTRLVESVSGTVTGSLLAVSAAGWVACGRSSEGEALVVAAAVALAAASAVSAVRMPEWLTSLAVAAAGAGAGAVLGSVLPVLGNTAGLLAGMAVGILVAAQHALFHPILAESRWQPAMTAVVLPVAVSGMLVYIVGRVLLG